jgi:hypothetical protein
MLTAEERWVAEIEKGYWFKARKRELQMFAEGLVSWGREIKGFGKVEKAKEAANYKREKKG